MVANLVTLCYFTIGITLGQSEVPAAQSDFANVLVDHTELDDGHSFQVVTTPDPQASTNVQSSVKDASSTVIAPVGVLIGAEAEPANVLSGPEPVVRAADVTRAEWPDCPMECTIQMRGDGWCNTQCATPACGNDGNDCVGWCAPDCRDTWIGDARCDKDCFRAECQWDGGDCDGLYTHGDILFPPPDPASFDYSQCQCELRFLHNGRCDPDCDTKECNWDGGDCLHQCSFGCMNFWLGDQECDTACFTEACGYDKGDCAECSPGCRPDRIGNGICDGTCMTDACNWDMGDCAGVCKVYPVDYDTLPFEYNQCRTEWTGDGFCDCFCMNSDCHNDYNDCAGFETECAEQIREAEMRSGGSWPLALSRKAREEF